MEQDHDFINTMMCSSPEIVEIGDDDDDNNKSFNVTSNTSRDRGAIDVYVAVGKDDSHVVKWALDHAVSPGARLFLVHVFPPLTYIPTPIGRLARSQLSQEQLKVYVNEENNRRKNLLQKYIGLCNDAKVPVETMLLESNATTKAVLDLIPVLNITQLVIGTKTSPTSRRLMKKMSKGEVVKRNAPDSCEVSIVHDGKKVVEGQQVTEKVHASDSAAEPNFQTAQSPHQIRKKFFECGCFPGKLVA